MRLVDPRWSVRTKLTALLVDVYSRTAIRCPLAQVKIERCVGEMAVSAFIRYRLIFQSKAVRALAGESTVGERRAAGPAREAEGVVAGLVGNAALGGDGQLHAAQVVGGRIHRSAQVRPLIGQSIVVAILCSFLSALLMVQKAKNSSLQSIIR